jgi:hypothetical protein
MNESGGTGEPWLPSRSAFLLFVVVALAGLYLVVTHSTHVLGVLPYVVLLACPLMHFLHPTRRQAQWPRRHTTDR